MARQFLLFLIQQHTSKFWEESFNVLWCPRHTFHRNVLTSLFTLCGPWMLTSCWFQWHIFDSGDREVDVAMTYVFGGFNGDFYDGKERFYLTMFSSSEHRSSLIRLFCFLFTTQKGYESEWPLPPGHEKRRTVYNLYHILNHDVLFGGGYINQARSMIDKILKC